MYVHMQHLQGLLKFLLNVFAQAQQGQTVPTILKNEALVNSGKGV